MSTANTATFLQKSKPANDLTASANASSNGGGGGSTQTVTRTLCVHIQGSLQDMGHRGPLAGLWKAANGQESTMFHPNLESTLNPEQNNNLVNNLRNGVIKKLTIKEHQSTFPYILGVDISCIPPTEVTHIGEKWAYTVLPNSSINTPQTIYVCDHMTQEKNLWHNQFPAFNASNLETHGVMEVPNHPFLFVHMDHPVIALLRYNQNLIGCDIDAQQKLEKEYFKVSKQVMATCCQTIRDEVLSKMNTRDLNLFTLQLRRLNNTPWDEVDNTTLLGFKMDPNLSPEEQFKQKQAHIKSFMTTPYQYMARLEVEYEIPTSTNVA